MPSLRQTTSRPTPANPQLDLPGSFPGLPRSIRERFGADAEQYDAEMGQFWTRTKRALSEAHADMAEPINVVRQDTRNVRKEFAAADATLSASFTEQIETLVTADSALATRTETLESQVQTAGTGLLARVSTVESTYATKTYAEARRDEAIVAAAGDATAKVSSEAGVRAGADGFLSSKYTLKAAVRGLDGKTIITGLNITSSINGGTDISEVNIQADRLSVVTATGPAIQLVDLRAGGFVLGTDLISDNFVAGVSGFRLGRTSGILEAVGGVFSGALYSQVGLVGGFNLASNHIYGGSGSSQMFIYADAASGLQWGNPSGIRGIAFANGAVAQIDLCSTGSISGLQLSADSNGGLIYLRNGTSGLALITLNGQSGAISANSFSGSHSGNGASLTSLDAGNIASGTLSNSRLSFTPGSMASQALSSVFITGGSINGCTSNGFIFSGGGGEVVKFAWDSANSRFGLFVNGVLKTIISQNV